MDEDKNLCTVNNTSNSVAECRQRCIQQNGRYFEQECKYKNIGV